MKYLEACCMHLLFSILYFFWQHRSFGICPDQVDPLWKDDGKICYQTSSMLQTLIMLCYSLDLVLRRCQPHLAVVAGLSCSACI